MPELRKAGSNPEIIAEYRLLNALVRNPSYLDDSRVTEDVFINETAKSFFEAITDLHGRGIDITQPSLFQAAYNIDITATEQEVKRIFEFDPEGASTLDDIIHTLTVTKAKKSVLDKVESIRKSLMAPGDLDLEKINNRLFDIEQDVSKIGKPSSKLLSYQEWTDRYIQDLEERKKGRRYSFGDIHLDKYLFKGAAPGCITIVTAQTNMGKSTYVLSLMDGAIENNIPCMYISLEMGTIDTMDRLVASRLGIENQELYNPENMEGIIEQVQEEAQNLSNRKNFYFCEATGVDIAKLRALVREFKQKTKKDYCIVAIDLLSGMKGFMSATNGASTANAIEVNMNKLEELAKDENIHIIGVVQLNRSSDNYKISHVEQINGLRPGLGDVKNSGAYAEKATTLLALFRPKYYADRYCKEDPASATLQDILEVQVLKDRNAQAGKIFKYMFDGKYFRLLPLMEDEDPGSIDSLRDIDF
jgi:replicative DNA helicase